MTAGMTVGRRLAAGRRGAGEGAAAPVQGVARASLAAFAGRWRGIPRRARRWWPWSRRPVLLALTGLALLAGCVALAVGAAVVALVDRADAAALAGTVLRRRRDESRMGG
ncbi:hypothetical protein GCM10020219_082810 [Nonomuraea dietziae]